MHTWVFILWLAIPGTATTPSTQQAVAVTATTRLRCEQDLMRHLTAEATTILAVSRCTEVRPWLRLDHP